MVQMHCMAARQVRFPKSKKKRIRRKWAKRPENFKWEAKVLHMPASMITRMKSC